MELLGSANRCTCSTLLSPIALARLGHVSRGEVWGGAGEPCVSHASISFNRALPKASSSRRQVACRKSSHAAGLLRNTSPPLGQKRSTDPSNAVVHQMQRKTVAQALKIDRSRTAGSELERGNDDDEVCPLECVKEVYSQAELQHHLEEAGPNSLVVVDFFRTACGSCKYIEKGFMKLCKGESRDEEEGGQHHVVFLKHNVMNEYDEQSDIAENLRIKVVPLFHFYKAGKLVESFATRDKNRLLATIYQYTNRESEIPKLLET